MECMRNNFYEDAYLDGRYKTLAPLNHGSFGMVFKARDISTGDVVALKCLTKPSAAAAAGASPFAIDDRSEELAIHRLIGDHPNIVNLQHSFETDHHIYLVLEFCPNGDLYEAIRVGRGPGQTEHVREAMLQLLDAVEYMHTNKVYHRDIKPENIFLSQSGAMKIGDFGLATMESNSFECAVGSDRYMAPEQMDPGSSGYSPAKADIWALGICLLNVLFSRNPFTSPTLSDPLFADFVHDRQSLFDVFPNMSQDTFDVLVHCLALDPQSRSISAARDAIKKAVSFTTEDECMDDFCANPPAVVPASANREPLRTPSISSPQMDAAGAFPWAKALAMTPTVRQLSVIPDTELSEDLYHVNKPQEIVQPDNLSMLSFVDSGLGVSLNSSKLSVDVASAARSMPVPIAGSLPINVARPGGSMTAVFGRRREFESKSWSDLWDEEEEEQNAQPVLDTDGDLTGVDTVFFRNTSFPTLSDEDSGADTPRAALSEVKNPSSVNNARGNTPEKLNLDHRVSEQTGFFFEEHHDSLAVKHPISPFGQKYSPPSKRSVLDKWAALGDRRRQLAAKDEAAISDDATPIPASFVPRKRGRAGSWRKNINWGVWGQGHQKPGPPTPVTGGTESSSIAPDTKRDWMIEDWRKQSSQVHLGSGRNSGRQFEWVWGM